MAQEREARINGEITAREIRLIGAEGEQLGIVSFREAIALAEEKDVDLVEISPTAQPPVCKLMDYGKFKYEQSKKRHEAKQKQKQIQIKEIKFRPGTDDGDYNVKLRNLIRFLTEGDKAKVTLRFRGREMAHQDIGLQLLKRVEADLAEVGTVEQFPRLEGRQMVMMIAPKKK
ncbi:translation initiation factor IF-3 [Crenobacter luteus]|uniref:translation initiation factor IF-3 n=1 Tax=Crenobacter luteus TaxID=1452487 RepID=UPI0009EE2767|nr:translation initiation factor IF-3 [Crenobacter luteus]